MIITAKEGRQNKIHIFIDEEYLLTVDNEFWLLGDIRSGDEIDEQQLELFKSQAAYRRAYNRALDIISRREHSRFDLVNKLTQRCCDRETAEKIADKLENIGLLDDLRYSRLLLRELSEYKKMGKNRIKQEFFKHGISREIFDEIIVEVEDNPHQNIKEIIERKYIGRMNDEKGKARAINGLLRMGYSYSDIYSVINDMNIDIDGSCD
ncbi:MAG: recombination regulator RecX [Clostridiales bacterium]|nr:recombination regulator RecX [Clostridiales bacterium]